MKSGSFNERAFVVQKHWASHLHYDFRLELDGTMKSWAVPKGPSHDPSVKRMAIETEDHAIAYNRFEGTIAQGNYGAGKVAIWDRGTWIPEGDAQKGYRSGHLSFILKGFRMRGRWMLIRMKTHGSGKHPSWLLIKAHDVYARDKHNESATRQIPRNVEGRRNRRKTSP